MVFGETCMVTVEVSQNTGFFELVGLYSGDSLDLADDSEVTLGRDNMCSYC